MHFTKEENIPGVAVFLDLEKALDSLNAILFINVLKRLITVLTSNYSLLLLSYSPKALDARKKWKVLQ